MKQNEFTGEVADAKWAQRKLPFKTMKSDDLWDFPEPDEKQMIIFFTGTYQLK